MLLTRYGRIRCLRSAWKKTCSLWIWAKRSQSWASIEKSDKDPLFEQAARGTRAEVTTKTDKSALLGEQLFSWLSEVRKGVQQRAIARKRNPAAELKRSLSHSLHTTCDPNTRLLTSQKKRTVASPWHQTFPRHVVKRWTIRWLFLVSSRIELSTPGWATSLMGCDAPGGLRQRVKTAEGTKGIILFDAQIAGMKDGYHVLAQLLWTYQFVSFVFLITTHICPLPSSFPFSVRPY